MNIVTVAFQQGVAVYKCYEDEFMDKLDDYMSNQPSISVLNVSLTLSKQLNKISKYKVFKLTSGRYMISHKDRW